MANQPNIVAGGPLPGTIYPQISGVKPSQQYIGKGFGQLGGRFAYGVSTWSEEWQIPFDDASDKVISGIIGYSEAGGPATAAGIGNAVMHRTLPVQHPFFPWLWGVSVSNPQGVGSRGQLPIGGGNGAAGGTVNKWRQLRFSVEYETPPYDILTDAAVAGADSVYFPAEAQRYCVWGREPANEFVQQEQDAFRWQDKPYGPTPSAGQQVQGSKGLALLLAKFRVSCDWLQVCDDWVRNGSVSFPYIDLCIGTVNQNEFMSMPPGTMLFEGYRATPRTMPVRIRTGNQSNSGTVPRCWDIHLQWLYFNPCPVGAVQANDGGFRYGHNLVFSIPTQRWWRPLLGTKNHANDSSQFWRYNEQDHSFIFKQPSKVQSYYCNALTPVLQPAKNSIFN
jgi:hypothetical protein